MHSYELIEHTADVRLHVKADSLSALFNVSIIGMNKLISPESSLSSPSSITESLDIDAPDSTALLIDFMNEVLAYSHIHNALFAHVSFDTFSSTSLSGTIQGFSIDHFEEDIKAVTYHEAQIKLNDDGLYETMIVFDI